MTWRNTECGAILDTLRFDVNNDAAMRDTTLTAGLAATGFLARKVVRL